MVDEGQKEVVIQEESDKSLYAHVMSTDNEQPQIQQITAREASVEIKWNPVRNVAQYKVSCWTNEQDKRTAQTRSTSYTFTKLKTGEVYFADLTCVRNGNNTSKTSETMQFHTAPRAPTNLQAECYEASPHDSIIVTLDDDNEWDVIHEVTITSIDGKIEGQKTTANRTVLFEKLIPGQSYTISAVAISKETTAAAGAGSNPRQTGGDGHDREIDRTSDHSITEPKVVGDSSRSDVGQTSRSTDQQRQRIIVYPKSKMAYGDHIITTYPAAPAHVHCNDTDQRLELTWEKPDIKPTKYHVYWEANEEKHENDYPTEQFFSITNLKPSTTYRYKVASINSAGRSNFSQEGKYVTAPAAPVNVVAMKNPHNSETSFIVRFDDPDPTPKKYIITAEPMDETVGKHIETESHTAVLNDLNPGQPYFIYVVAMSMVDGEKKSGRAYFKKTDVKMD